MGKPRNGSMGQFTGGMGGKGAKNGGLRPGEGHWECQQCGNKNFAKREVCHTQTCGASRPDDFIIDGEKAVRGGLKDGEEYWQCPECMNLNFASRDTCNTKTCRAAKPDDVEMQEYDA